LIEALWGPATAFEGADPRHAVGSDHRLRTIGGTLLDMGPAESTPPDRGRQL